MLKFRVRVRAFKAEPGSFYGGYNLGYETAIMRLIVSRCCPTCI